MIFADIRMAAHWGRFWTAAEKTFIGRAQANAIANAIEQYFVDFPEPAALGNSREWTERLSGRNPKGIQYIRPGEISSDAEGRLLDPCGQPWIIEVPGSARYETMATPESPDEFHIRSSNCGGFAFGHWKNPKYSRS